MENVAEWPAVFLDRDGVIIVDKNYQIEIESIEFFPDTVLALGSIDPFYKKVVISNQSGIARGYFTEGDVEEFNRFLSGKLRENGIVIDGWYYCPHGPDEGCYCRKPRPGMLERSARELSIDLKNSWIIGDKSSDIEAGRAIGVKTILVRTGYSGNERGASDVRPDYFADNLLQAVELINRSVI